MFQRYAVYHTPRGALARAGSAWLGWDIATGTALPHPQVPGIDDPAALTLVPRKYGLHATIKPPFALSSNSDAAHLGTDFTRLCARLAPVSLDRLEIRALGRFLALVPVGDQTALERFAASVVRELDAHRAPPGDAELARRRQRPLSPAQERNLRDWGYPYVMDQFRFHITLTGPLTGETGPVACALRPYFAPHLSEPYVIDSLTLVGEDKTGMFHEILKVPLGA